MLGDGDDDNDLVSFDACHWEEPSVTMSMMMVTTIVGEVTWDKQ